MHYKHRLVLRLFIAGPSLLSQHAVAAVYRLCEHIGLDCDLVVVDVLQEPNQAEAEKILATPTLIKTEPPPVRRVIGDLSNPARLLAALNLTADDLREDLF